MPHRGSSKICWACLEGTYQPNTNATNCINCPAGTYNKNKGSGSIKNCLVCPGSLVSPEVYKECVSKCPAGTYTVGHQCLHCQPGTYSYLGATFCDVYGCNPGLYNGPNSQCIQCPIGKYSSIKGLSMCNDCPNGMYTDELGSIKCKDPQCPDGTYSTSKTSKICKDCEAGYYCKNSIRNACPDGTYNSNTKQSDISSCISSGCVSGTYSTSSTKKACSTSCVAGYYCNNGAKIACSKGTYSPLTTLSSPCTSTCPAGKSSYNASTTISQCTNCIASSYSNGGDECKVCPNHLCSIEGASLCTSQCPTGYYALKGIFFNVYLCGCVPCPVGSYCVNDVKINCPAGTYNSKEKQTTSASCISCAPKYSALGSSACTSTCPTQSYFLNTTKNTCTVCDAGYYCKDKNRISCPAGTYNALKGQYDIASCIPCPLNKYSFAGASICSDSCGVNYFKTNSSCIQCRTCSKTILACTETQDTICSTDSTVQYTMGVSTNSAVSQNALQNTIANTTFTLAGNVNVNPAVGGSTTRKLLESITKYNVLIVTPTVYDANLISSIITSPMYELQFRYSMSFYDVDATIESIQIENIQLTYGSDSVWKLILIVVCITVLGPILVSFVTYYLITFFVKRKH
jgi:hypothetical protein